jgi:hypothetical protein
MISIVEATLDDPRAVLSQQEFLARGEAVAIDEVGGHRVRRADGTARADHAIRSRSTSC